MKRHEKIDATTDTVVESNSVMPVSDGSRKLSAVASVHSIALNIFGIISVHVQEAN
ncbi:MAG TPA: hypothetical protein VKL21_02610 [Candidatus Methanoperedens sp.]|nr:hypothetical protein [Candidatus Methanoperedens sp.]